MSKDLRILQLEDDLEQAGKEIKHLQRITENLVNDQKAHNATVSRLTIENNSLRLERDELRTVIQLADDGIADINTHWKQKFFMWRETESDLLKELSQSRERIQELSAEYEGKLQKQLREYEKLKSVIENSKEETSQLSQSLAKADDELKSVNVKLMEESRKNVHNMFLARENELLNAKVHVLETKVNSFYEESIQNSQDFSQNDDKVRQEAERDFNVMHHEEVKRLNLQIAELTKNVNSKDTELRYCKEEINQLSCQNESQVSKIKQLRKQLEMSSNSLTDYSSAVKSEQEKLKKANEIIDDMDKKCITLDKINDELKAENELKSQLVVEKDSQIQHYKSCYVEIESKFNGVIADVDNYKHTLNLAENEKLVISRDLDMWIAKHDSIKDCLDKVSSENIQLVKELDCSKSQIQALNEKCKDSDLEANCSEKALMDCQEKLATLEVELADKNFRFDELRSEKAFVDNRHTELLKEREELISALDEKERNYQELVEVIETMKRRNHSEVASLKEELSSKETRFREYKIEMEEKIQQVITLTEYSEKSTSDVSAPSTMLVDQGTITDPEPCPVSDSYSFRKQISTLKKQVAANERKLCHAESELAKQASTIVQKQCQIDQLNVKCAKKTSQFKESKEADYHLEEEIKRLKGKICELNGALTSKIEELEKIKASASELKKREQTYWELSGLVNNLQNELDSKHSNTMKEVNFYKNRLLEYERRTPSVNKSVNTSIQEEEDYSEADITSCRSMDGKSIDLKDLENVMNNLKSDYKHDLDAIHASFREKISEIEAYSDNNEQRWLDLMNK